MSASRNEDLLRRTKRFALRIIKVAVALPKNPVATASAAQLVKAGTSPGANYREAHRARSKSEFAAKIGDCLKEQDETLYWLELLAILTTIHKKART